MKKKFIGVIGIVIAVIVGGIYYLTREEKIEFVRYLDQKGAFLVTKSSERICEHLKVSRFTLYNYLDLIRKESNTNTETNKEE